MKIRHLLLGLGLLFVFACQPAGKKPQAEALNNGKQQAGGDFLLVPGQRIGPLYAAHSLENDLVQTFGVQNVKRRKYTWVKVLRLLVLSFLEIPAMPLRSIMTPAS